MPFSCTRVIKSSKVSPSVRDIPVAPKSYTPATLPSPGEDIGEPIKVGIAPPKNESSKVSYSADIPKRSRSFRIAGIIIAIAAWYVGSDISLMA